MISLAKCWRRFPALSGATPVAVLGAVLLVAVTAATRLPLLSAWPGEPDSAWFVIGAEQWRRFGPQAPQIYDRLFSPAYYWLAAKLAAYAHDFQHLTWDLNLVSVLASLVLALLVWELGRRLTAAAAAFWSSLLFLLSPAVWWLGIEPHPQGLAITLFLAAMLVFIHWHPQPRWLDDVPAYAGAAERTILPAASIRRQIVLGTSALAALSASLLVRADGALMLMVFPVLAARSHAYTPARSFRERFVQWLRHSRDGWLLAIAALLVFWMGRALLLHQSWRGAENRSWREIFNYLGGLNWEKQALPMLTAPGLLVAPAVVAGLVYGLCHDWRSRQRGRGDSRGWAWHWLPIAAVFSIPAYGFWLLLRGNNCRHVALYALVWLWPAAEALSLTRRRLLPVFATALVACNFLLMPPTSNLTLYPSGNVFAAARRLHHRERQVTSLATHWLSRNPRRNLPRCYLGSNTTPYLLWSMEQLSGKRIWIGGSGAGSVQVRFRICAWPHHLELKLWMPGVYSRQEFLHYALLCSDWRSLEYAAGGGPQYFFGRRLHVAWRTHRENWLYAWLSGF